MMTPKGTPHPSGRPVRRHEVKSRKTIWNIPDEESNVPRLRQSKKDLDCIGFVHRFQSDDDGN